MLRKLWPLAAIEVAVLAVLIIVPLTHGGSAESAPTSAPARVETYLVFTRAHLKFTNMAEARAFCDPGDAIAGGGQGGAVQLTAKEWRYSQPGTVPATGQDYWTVNARPGDGKAWSAFAICIDNPPYREDEGAAS